MRRAAMLAIPTLMLVSCTGTQITTTLQTVVDAVSIALPILAATTGMTPAQDQEITKYLKTVSTAIKETTAELATMDSSAIKAGKIAGFFAAAALPAIPGLSPTVQMILQTVSAAVGQFLSTLRAAPSPTVSAVSAAPPVKITFDKTALAYIVEKNTRNLAILERQ